ncbi:MAG TPA: glycosyltransferase family 4 protein [Tepidisphaeraceae bacterium]|nr:glycosyltransferase family 4 protein [Tepidisphaeraceae bacterium]
MNIALVILHADAARGGAERYTMDLAAALIRRGHGVALLASSHADVPAGAAPVELGVSGLTRAGRYGRFLEAVSAEVSARRFDVVHAMLPIRACDVYHPHAGVAAAAQERWNIHLNPRRKRMARVERELLSGPRPPITIALSQYVKRSIRQHYPLADDRLVTLFNAVDLGRFQPAPQRPPRDYVNGLFVGQDFERKGLMQALVAASMLKEPRLKITVVGRNDGTFRPPPDAAAQVSFAGDQPDPGRFYRDADFLVLPTRHDPCSLVVLEALASGLPVISTKFNGATEIMTDGQHGYVLDDPNDVNALAAAMRKLLDPDRRAEMSQACVALRPRLSYEHHLDQLEAIYRRARA